MDSQNPSPATPPPPPPPDDLQFDRVEYAAPDGEATSSAAACTACKNPIAGIYYEVNGQIICPTCKVQLQESIGGGSKVWRMTRAFVFGLVAMVGTAIAYYFVRRMMDAEFAIATIAMGWLIGTAVHRGAQGRGGLFYQLAAVGLTYCAISLSYVPVLFEVAAERTEETVADTSRNSDPQAPAPSSPDNSVPAKEATSASLSAPLAETPSTNPDESQIPEKPYSAGGFVFGLVAVCVFALTLPVQLAMESPIMILIYAFGLWQAFQMNRRPHIEVTGPYNTGGGVATSPNMPQLPPSRDNQIV